MTRYRRNRGRSLSSFSVRSGAETLEVRSLLSALSVGKSGLDLPQPAPQQPEYVSDELLVQFTPQVTSQQAKRIAESFGLQVSQTIHTATMQHFGDGPMLRVATPVGSQLQQYINRLQQHPRIQYAEPNYIYRASYVSNDSSYTAGNLWGMYSNDNPSAGPAGTTNQFGSAAEQAWRDGFIGSSSTVVGVIDTGIQIDHPDLAANIWTNPYEVPNDGLDNDGNGYADDVHGWDFADGDNSVYDSPADDHGTHVSGTITGTGGNGIGVAGVNWNATIISGKFLNPTGTTANAILAVDYFTDLKIRHGMNIVATNNSWGGGGYSQGLHSAIIRHAKSNILFVAAAGNAAANNDTTANYPSNYNTTVATTTETAASYDGVIAVASIDSASAPVT